MNERINLEEGMAAGAVFAPKLSEHIESHVECDIVHQRPRGDGTYEILSSEHVINQITNAGRDFLHQQGYQTSGLGANGLNYIALTNTNVTPAAGDTTLSGEIVANGLSRTQGVVAHSAGTNTTTIANTFTCATAPQAAQAAALFTASSSGTMNHELNFTQRSLQIGDQLVVTYTITLG